MIKVNNSICTKCALCSKICPFTILEMSDGYPRMIEKKEKACLKCMHCVSICPVNAISFENVPEIVKESILPALNSYDDLKNLILSNRSIRHFSSKPVPYIEIEEILNIANFAPSAKNQHPTKWILVYDSAKVKELMSHILKYVEDNNVSKEIISEYKIGNNVVTLDAPHLLFGIAPKEGAVNPYTDTIIALTDVDLLLHSKSIGSCWAGYLARLTNANPIIRELIGLDDSMQIYAALAFGYPLGEKYERLPYRDNADISII